MPAAAAEVHQMTDDELVAGTPAKLRQYRKTLSSHQTWLTTRADVPDKEARLVEVARRLQLVRDALKQRTATRVSGAAQQLRVIADGLDADAADILEPVQEAVTLPVSTSTVVSHFSNRSLLPKIQNLNNTPKLIR